MTMLRRQFLRGWLAAWLLAAGWLVPVRAGDSAPTVYGVALYGEEAIRALALRLNDELDARKVNLAIVARSGRLRAKMPQGIRYTHVAFIVFEPVVGADGQPFHTYTVYNLYQGEQDAQSTSYLKQDFTFDFVAGIVEPDVAVCVPVEALQQRIVRTIRSPAYQALHRPAYNLMANPWVDRYDNCVTHTLKICVAAIYRTDDRERIYENIRAYFTPTRVRLGPLQAFGSTFMPALKRDDMDRAGLQTATFDSLQTFLTANGLAKESFTVAVK